MGAYEKRRALLAQPRRRREAKPLLESLHLQNIGPAAEMNMDLAPRLNLITGDNGLGKSFLLDVAWWALTRTWAREMVIPGPGMKVDFIRVY